MTNKTEKEKEMLLARLESVLKEIKNSDDKGLQAQARSVIESIIELESTDPYCDVIFYW